MHDSHSCERNIYAVTNEITPRSLVACVAIAHAKHYAKASCEMFRGLFLLVVTCQSEGYTPCTAL
jgi:hypothetical protein